MNPLRPHKANFVLLTPILGLLFLSAVSNAQLTLEWDKTYGGQGWEELQAMALAPDGGYLFGGITTTTEPSSEVSQADKDTVQWPELTGDFWLVKADSLGNFVWDRRYGGDRQDRMWSIHPTDDGGFLLGGESRSNVWGDRTDPNRGGSDYWIVKIDGEGNVEWEEAYGGPGDDFLRESIPLADGGYLLAGFSNSDAGGDKTENSRGGSDFWIIRLNADRSIQWQRTFGGGQEDQLFDAVKAHDAGFVLAGWSASDIGFEKTAPWYGANDFWIIKIDETGNLLWQRTLGGDLEDVCQAIAPTSDGHYLFLGQSSSASGTGNKNSPTFGQWDAWIVKVNDQGTSSSIAWQQSFGGASGDIAYGAAQNSLGDYLVLGLSFSEADTTGNLGTNFKESPLLGASDFWVLFLEPDGEKIWEETLGGANTDSGIKIANAHGYGFILAGHSSSEVSPPYKSEPSRGLNDMWVIRTGCSFPGPELADLPKVCRDEFVEVDATIGDSCQFCLYFWSDGSTGPLQQFTPDSTMEVKVTVLHPDGCSLSDSVIIEVVPGPESLLADGEPVSCYGKADAEFFIENVVGGTPPYQFSLNGGDWEDFAHYVNLPPGQYVLDILDFNGCPFDTAFFIDQPEQVLVELGPDIYLDLGDSVQLQALTNQLDSFYFEWGQPEQVSCDCLEPWVSPFYTTTFSIRLVDKNGCEARDFLRVVIEQDDAVYIPNVFSPNNDNINDFFTIYADASVRQVNTLMVFDRWGEKMFEARDFQPNIEQIGWDGRLDGKPMQPAVYVYWAEVEYVDGRTGFFEGSLTLIR